MHSKYTVQFKKRKKEGDKQDFSLVRKIMSAEPQYTKAVMLLLYNFLNQHGWNGRNWNIWDLQGRLLTRFIHILQPKSNTTKFWQSNWDDKPAFNFQIVVFIWSKPSFQLYSPHFILTFLYNWLYHTESNPNNKNLTVNNQLI